MLLHQPDINYVFLAGLFNKYLPDENLVLTGNVLSIHDSADQLGITPRPYFERSPDIGRHQSVVTDKGVGHGLVYQPYKEWLVPAMDWIKQKHLS